MVECGRLPVAVTVTTGALGSLLALVLVVLLVTRVTVHRRVAIVLQVDVAVLAYDLLYSMGIA